MIDQNFQFSVAAAAPPANVMPSVFNPIPADGFLEVWACLDPSTNFPADQQAQLSVTLGGATPYQPLQPSAIRVNIDGVAGAGPSEQDRMMTRQGVRQGTNAQLILQGGTGHTQSGRIRVRFMSGAELAAGSGEVAS